MRPGAGSSTLCTCVAFLNAICAFKVVVAGCPQGWYGWRDSCYIPLAHGVGWHEALAVCRRSGSNLVVPNSVAEHQFITGIRSEWFGGKQQIWTDCGSITGKFACTSNSELVSANCCIYIAKYNGGKLKMAGNCNYTRRAVCEMPGSVFSPIYCSVFGADGRVAPKCLHGHEIKNLTVKGVGECGQVCWAEPRCRSFNLWQEGSLKICQLNNATRLEVNSLDFIEQEKCIYFGL